MDIDRQFFIESAKLLVTVYNCELAHRYLAVLRRRATLRGGIREAQTLGRADNALAMVGFKPPLSVAGSRSDIVVRAEGLARRGIPVAFELDPKRRHRGTSIDEVREALEAETGRHWSERETLEEYADFMSTHPRAIHLHPLKRYAKIPRLLERSKIERDAMELELWEQIKGKSHRIFCVAVESESLKIALVGLKDSVVLGYAGLGAPLRVGKEPVTTAYGSGRGLVVVNIHDLRSLLGPPGTILTIDCDRGGWSGVLSMTAAQLQLTLEDYEAAEPAKFKYYEGRP